MNDQNYYRPGSIGGFSLFPPVIKFLLISNIAIFLFTEIIFPGLSLGNESLADLVMKYFALNPIEPINVRMTSGSAEQFVFYPWQIITYMFLHGGFGHIFFNMFALWMFGMELENLWGSKKFLIYYTICGIGAAAANLFISPLFGPAGPTIGASGAIYGVLVAFGFIFPNRNIYIYFLIPIKAKYLVILYMALEVIYLTTSSQTGVAHAAHLGGAVVGFLYLIFSQRGTFNILDKYKREREREHQFKYTPPPRNTGGYYQPQNGNNEVYTTYEEVKNDEKKRREEEQAKLQARIDEILDKLAQGGYNNLTEEEKRFLFEESKKLR